jgi:tetratricopeptide (TPR) repeat protein
VSALGHLGRYEEAIEAARWAGEVLEAHGQLQPLVGLTANLGLVLGHAGRDAESLEQFDRAARISRQISAEPGTAWYLIQLNRSLALRALGRFEEAISASHIAVDGFERQGEMADAARSRQALALTFFVMGRYNEALQLLEEAREIYRADGRAMDAMLALLFASECLLRLRRFDQVLEATQLGRIQFQESGARDYLAQAILLEAIALAELHRYAEASASFEEARRIFQDEGNANWVAVADTAMASVLLSQGRPEASLELANRSAEVFHSLGLPWQHAQALVVGARAALALGRWEEAQGFAARALETLGDQEAPSPRYQAHAVLGEAAQLRGDSQSALHQYDRAIGEVERIRGSLMIEHRPGFQEDKESLYGRVVLQCLEMNDPAQALEYVERAKSRSLLDLLAHHLDLGVHARGPEDESLVRELGRVRKERDRLVRHWQGAGAAGERGDMSGSRDSPFPPEILALEKNVTELWHRLLVRNADYARDASLWTVRTEPAQSFLGPDTLLLEYYVAMGDLVAFSVTGSGIEARRWTVDWRRVQDGMRLLWLNLQAVRSTEQPRQLEGLQANAESLLASMYAQVFEPLGQTIDNFQKVIIVPHGLLHYLPFHALFHQGKYLLESHEIRYLPSSSTLRYCREMRPNGTGALAVGHSHGGLLPHALEEARSVAAALGGKALLEDEATPERVRAEAGGCRVVHFATHGDFRADNPLFSGLALHDGWLTTLDTFSLRLNADLVTLSACQTGRSVVGGGDELLGLTRGFLSAGAASLVLTHWAVEDRSTSALMEVFYKDYGQGVPAAEALRGAQLGFLRGSAEGALPGWRHPYFWAPFYLVGSAAPDNPGRRAHRSH